MHDSKARQAAGIRTARWLRDVRAQHAIWHSRQVLGEVPEADEKLRQVLGALECLEYALECLRADLKGTAREKRRERERAA
jgi:hypothetical protein